MKPRRRRSRWSSKKMLRRRPRRARYCVQEHCLVDGIPCIGAYSGCDIHTLILFSILVGILLVSISQDISRIFIQARP